MSSGASLDLNGIAPPTAESLTLAGTGIASGGALTNTSVALRDALLGSHLPAVEVHISNLYRREDFRHTSLTAPACLAVITGLGLEGYHAAIRFLLKR